FAEAPLGTLRQGVTEIDAVSHVREWVDVRFARPRQPCLPVRATEPLVLRELEVRIPLREQRHQRSCSRLTPKERIPKCDDPTPGLRLIRVQLCHASPQCRDAVPLLPAF